MGGSHVVTRGLRSGRGKIGVRGRCDYRRNAQTNVPLLALEMEKGSYKPGNVGDFQGLEKARCPPFPPEASERSTSLLTP